MRILVNIVQFVDAHDRSIMNIKETLSEIRKKYRLLADAECQQIFNDYYCNQFDTTLVKKTADSIQIDDEIVSNIKIDQYNNLNCDTTFMLPEYLRYFRLILNTYFQSADHAYYLRLGSHFFINYFRQHYKLINDDYLEHMISIDDHMPKEKGGNSFREWLLGRNNDGRGELRYIKPPQLKNLVQSKEGWTWHRSKDDCSVCKGEKGGVKGNENIIDGKLVCDYCSVKLPVDCTQPLALTTLRYLVSKMDVPAEHKDDLIWLAKNLATNNKKHSDFPEAVHLIASLFKMTGQDIEIIGRN